MRRGVVVLATGALALFGAERARAQVAVYFQPALDTATGAVPGVPTPIEIRLRDSASATVQGATLTFYYDSTRMQILGVLPEAGVGLDSIADTTRGPGSFAITATGSIVGLLDAPLFQLQVQLRAAATSGTYIWVRSDSAQGTDGYLQSVGAIGQVCHATTVWGDVDGSGQIDSRDALIVLSAAVGLPATGFNLALGDVDGDGLANSRDALMMLSYAIGLPVTGARIAVGAPDACPGLTAPGDSVVFLRNDVPTGLYALGASSTSPVAIPGATNVPSGDPQARLAADGRSIVYVCPAASGEQICRVDADTGGVVQLTDDTLAVDESPDWSPSGDSIVYLVNGEIMKMAANGSGQAPVLAQTGVMFASEVKWGRVRTKLAFSNGPLYVFDPTISSNPVQVATGFSDINGLRWSPAGDSIAFVRSTDPRLWVVPAAGGTPTIMLGLTGQITGGDWSSAGIVLSLNTGAGAPGIWYLKGMNTPIYRVTRPTTFDRGPSWRRSP